MKIKSKQNKWNKWIMQSEKTEYLQKRRGNIATVKEEAVSN